MTLTRRHLLAGAGATAAVAALPAAVATGGEKALHSIVVTSAEFPIAGREYVLRHAERFWIARMLSVRPGPPSVMPSHVVTWDVDPDRESEAYERVRHLEFALDARTTGDEALEWHAIDEAHYREHADDLESSRVAMRNPADTAGPSLLPSESEFATFAREKFGLCNYVVIDDRTFRLNKAC